MYHIRWWGDLVQEAAQRTYEYTLRFGNGLAIEQPGFNDEGTIKYPNGTDRWDKLFCNSKFPQT
jgi:hypothetical protein